MEGFLKTFPVFIVLVLMCTTAFGQTSAIDWYNKGVNLSKEFKYDDAIQAFDKAIKINPQYADAWFEKGFALYNQKKYDEAAEAWNNEGNVLMVQKNYAMAEWAYNLATETNQRYAEAWSNKGFAFYKLGMMDQALDAYNNSIKIDPSSPSIWANRGAALSGLGKLEELNRTNIIWNNLEHTRYLSFIFSTNPRELMLVSNGFIGSLSLLILFILIIFARASNKRNNMLRKGKASTTLSVSETFKTFQAVRSKYLLLVLQFLPWILLCASVWLILVDVLFGPDYRYKGQLMMKGLKFSISYGNMEMSSQLLGYGLGLLAVRQLFLQIPITLRTLWNRNIIAIDSNSDIMTSNISGEKIDSTTSQLNAATLEKQYQIYINEFEDRMNDTELQWTAGIIFVILFAGPFLISRFNIFQDSGIFTLVKYNIYKYNLFLVTFEQVAECIALILVTLTAGFMIWRIVITGWQIRRLGKVFDLVPQLGHPDECGGLSPLGYLCLWIALICSVIGAVLGAWSILWPYLGYESSSTVYWTLLPIPIALAFCGFFLPLWNIHHVMVGKRIGVQKQLDQLGRSIDRLESEMLIKGDDLEPDEAESIAKKIELLRQTYQRNLQYRTWPFNIESLKKLFLYQTIPVLSLLSQVLPQIGKTSVDTIKIIVESISQWWH